VRERRERDQATVGAVTIVVLVLAVVAALKADNLPFIGGGTHYTAYFSESAGLVAGNEVRVAGVKVGKVIDVSLAKNQIKVDFEVKDTWLGNSTTASIQIKTLLGEKYLALDPEGGAVQNPSDPIPKSRTLSPFDITDAVNELATTAQNIDTNQLARSFEVIAQTFANSAQGVRDSLNGLTALSRTIASRDQELAQLLSNTAGVSAVLADRDSQFQQLLTDGNALLTELQTRRDAIAALLSGTQNLATQLAGVVADNQAQLNPALTDLSKVTTMLAANQANLEKGLAELAPFARLFTNTVGNGRWFDGYLCGLLPPATITQIFQINPGGCTAPLAASAMSGGGANR